jgi:penicillin-binding protein 2
MRIKIIIAIFSVIWLGLLVRIFYLSIQSNNYYESLADKNSIKVEKIIPIRGEIVDINNKPLAINKLGFKIKIKPHLNRKTSKKDLEKIIDDIATLLPSASKEKMLKEYIQKDSYYNHHFIEVLPFVSYKEIMPVYSKLNLHEDIKILPAPLRHYPYKEVAAHLIGYVAKANDKDIKKDKSLFFIGHVGKSGVEEQYNKELKGHFGIKKVKVSAHNEEIEILEQVEPLDNITLKLTIDIRLQEYISKLFKDKVGAIIVMGVDGKILAAGSFPEYDLNLFVQGISYKNWNTLIQSEDKPFTNKFISGLYPPGSTIKTAEGLLFMDEGKYSPYTTHHCTGSVEVSNRNFRCWKHEGHKKTNLIKAIRESCDDYYYKGSMDLGIARISKAFIRYGLGKKTGIDLPREFRGTVPSRLWKQQKYNRPWYIGETLNTSIGQGDFLSTPLQIATLTALMATGKLPTPHVGLQIGDEVIEDKFEDVLNDNEKSKLKYIQKGMIEVCNHPNGTATRYLHSKVKLAGKTGTAQVVGIKQDTKTKDRLKEHDMEYYRRSHAWLTTYAPIKDPKYVVTALVEHGGHGGAAAGAMVSDIYNKMLEYGYFNNSSK